MRLEISFSNTAKETLLKIRDVKDGFFEFVEGDDLLRFISVLTFYTSLKHRDLVDHVIDKAIEGADDDEINEYFNEQLSNYISEDLENIDDELNNLEKMFKELQKSIN